MSNSKFIENTYFQKFTLEEKIQWICNGGQISETAKVRSSIFIMLGRPRTCVVGLLCYALGYSYTAHLPSIYMLLGAFLSFLWSFSANIHNTYTDFVEDSRNLPGRLNLVARFGYKNLLRSIWYLNILKIIIAAFLGIHAFIFAILVQPLVHQYSFPPLRLKARPILCLLVFCQAVVSPFILGLLTEPGPIVDNIIYFVLSPLNGGNLPYLNVLINTYSYLAMLAFLAVWFIAKGFFKNVPDFYGDRAAGLRTSATIFKSWRRAAQVTTFLTISAYLTLFIIIYQNWLPKRTLWAMIWLIPVIWNCMRLIRADNGPKGNECLKIDMIISMGFINTLLLLLFPFYYNLVITMVGIAIIYGSDFFGIDSRREQDTTEKMTSNQEKSMIFTKMAWRNLWRNKRRTIITLCVMSFCVAFMIYMINLAIGYHKGIINNSVKAGSGHIQVHKKDFHSVLTAKHYFKTEPSVFSRLNDIPDVKNHTLRIKTLGLVSYTNKSQNVMVIGIQPQSEPNISVFHNKNTSTTKGPLVEGEYLRENDYIEGYQKEDPSQKFYIPGILIGKKVAANFDISVGSKVVVTLQSLSNEIKQHLFEVRGIYQTLIPSYDEGTILIHYKTAQKLLSYEENYTSEIALVLGRYEQMNSVAKRLRLELGQEYEVLTWEDIHPHLVEFIEVDNFFIIFFVAILFIVACIGMIITLLMSVFERVREFGVMQALGMSSKRLILMVLGESLWIALLSCVFGSILITPVLYHTQSNGIDVSQFSEGASMWAISLDPTIYTQFELLPVLGCFVMVIILTLLISLYPALKATRMSIVQAIQFN